MHKNDIKKLNALGCDAQPFIFVISYDCQKVLVYNQSDLNQKKIFFSWPGQSNSTTAINATATSILQVKNQITLDEYRESFNAVQAELFAGNSYLTNLTFEHQLTNKLTLEDIFHQASAKYKLYLPNNFLCFSPETFLKTNNNTAHTFPMKGTSKLSQQTELINNQKEQAEQSTIVDLLRNDLSLICSNVRLNSYRYPESIAANHGETFVQTSSCISGELPNNWQKNLGSILNEMLPAGSVTGAPKNQTCQIINKLENYQRGFYSGVAGYFNGKDLDTCVLIRFIEKKSENFFFKSGGGITAESQVIEEYQEMIDKIYVPIS